MDLNGSEITTYGNCETYAPKIGGFNSIIRCDTAIVARPHSGSNALQILPNAATAVGFRIGATSGSLNGTVVGSKYTLEAWVYLAAAFSGSLSEVKLSIVKDNSVIIASSTSPAATATWTKLVVNFEVPAGSTGITPVVYLNNTAATLASTDTALVDDVSLTQAWDGVIGARVNVNSFATERTLLRRKNGDATVAGWYLTIPTTGRINLRLGDDINIASANAAADKLVVLNKEVFVIGTIDRTGLLTIYLSGENVGTVSAALIGRVVSATEVFYLGVKGGVSNFFSGTIREPFFIRYTPLPSDIARWIAHANTQRFIPEPPGGGETVLRIFGRRNDALDQSGNQGVLTNTGSTPIIQKQ